MCRTLLILVFCCSLQAWGARKSAADGRLQFDGPWQMQSSAIETRDGKVLSTPGTAVRGWVDVRVPTTVLNALVRAGVYPDPRIGTNAYLIPDSSDEFNQARDLAKYSHLPDKRNPWREPYWFRTEFEVPLELKEKRFWLRFDAINYRADVWMNGKQVAERTSMAGMFQRFVLDVTETAGPGPNCLAVKVYPVDHPGLPETQLEPLGKDRGYQSELMHDVTEIVAVGYDCMMTVPDRNMGLWQPVWLEWTGPVDIRNPFVKTELPLPQTDQAVLSISAELVNATDQPVDGVLSGTVVGTPVRFQQPVQLAAHETKMVAIDPKPVLAKPILWWPAGYGQQHLYTLSLRFETNRKTSIEREQQFGVRQLGYEMHEVNGWHGRRVLVNGQKIFCSGGYIQPELMFQWDRKRMEAEIRYYKEANLNLICFEDIPNPPEGFLELCDQYGILFGQCFYSCFWLRPGTPYPSDFGLLERCTVDVVKRYRNHPSLLFYMAMNEEDTKEEVYEMWRRHILELDGTRWFIPSAYFPSDRKTMGEWFKKDLPAGMTDKGASYSWAEPAWYFERVRETRNWMFMMESGSASVPPASSLAKFLTGIESPSAKQKVFPLDAAWAHHGANGYFQKYDEALRRLHGEPVTVADYCWKGHLISADQNRSMFEAVNHRMWDSTSGFTQWKINSCEPSVQWQIFDWYHKPMVSWYYTKKACEPLHVQLNLPDNKVSVINRRLAPAQDLRITARAFSLRGVLLGEKASRTNAPANGYLEVFPFPEPPGATPVYFVRLEIRNHGNEVVSDNFYWLRSQGTPDFSALESLPLVALEKKFRLSSEGGQRTARVTVKNPSPAVAFFVQLALTRGTRGEEILPVLWDDNYFTLLPGETREIAARFAEEDLAGAVPSVEVGGWNVETDYRCRSVNFSPPGFKAGQSVTMTVDIGDTFLDGSLVEVRINGKVVGTQRAWARGNRTQRLAFPGVRFDRAGKHIVTAGKLGVNILLDGPR